jgi:hypothetical protein
MLGSVQDATTGLLFHWGRKMLRQHKTNHMMMIPIVGGYCSIGDNLVLIIDEA